MASQMRTPVVASSWTPGELTTRDNVVALKRPA
jgi:hypothetical protein